MKESPRSPGVNPATWRSSVDFPEPDAPITATISPPGRLPPPSADPAATSAPIVSTISAVTMIAPAPPLEVSGVVELEPPLPMSG